MAKEIERKFLVKDNSFKHAATETHLIRQGYLSTDPRATVRVRMLDDKAYLTVKSKNSGAVRDEWEYPVPPEDARQMLAHCGSKVIDKERWIVPFEGHVWEVDVFGGRHQGLIVAEVEMRDADEEVKLPTFVGEEVTGNPEYYNSNLV